MAALTTANVRSVGFHGVGNVGFDAMGQAVQMDTDQKKLKMWEQEFFLSDMCESLIPRHGEAYGDYAAVLRIILENMLTEQLADEVRGPVVRMVQALTRSEVLFRRRQQHRMWHIPFHLSRICDDICKQLHTSSAGDLHIFPFDAGTSNIIVVEHGRNGQFHAGVINVHPLSTSYLPFNAASPPKVKMQSVLEIKNISKARITSEAFWACDLLSDCAEDRTVYTHFLPWLNNQTYAELLRDTPANFSTGTKGDATGNLWKTFVHAFKYVLRRSKVPEAVVKATRLRLKTSLLAAVRDDMKDLDSISHSTRLIVRAATQNAAMALTRNGRHLSESEFEDAQKLVKEIDVKVRELPCPDDDTTKPPPLLNITENWDQLQQPHLFPLAECHRRTESVEDFVGTAVEQPRYVPVNFFSIPQSVATFDEALGLLEELVSLCTRISSQLNVVRNAGFLISSLMTHVFAQVLPVPAGPKSRAAAAAAGGGAKRCIWDAPILYGQQLQCMKRLWQCAEYFVWASFSIKTTKEFDAQRIIVLGAIAAISDAVIRLIATDHPSVISVHLRGYKKKAPFAINVGRFATQTESSVTIYPHLLTARAAILDYHAELVEEVPSANVMWAWEDGWGFCKATQTFVRQVCLVEGFRTAQVMQYFVAERSGAHSIIGKYWEEYTHHRDIYILFKWMMAPKNKLPNCSSCLQCRVKTPELGADYGNHKLQVRYMHKEVHAKALQLRWPSFAIPSKFTAPFEAGSEDDVLHIKNLPTFDDVMGQRDSELLLSYLTAPYIRIPLVLNFFANEDRVSCLGNSTIKNLLEGVLFEPGKFLPRSLSDKIPQHVPAEDSNMLGTPYGLLLNELQFSPQGVVQPLLQLIKLAREMDAGTVHNSSVVDIILFLMRVVARVHSFVAFSQELAANPNHKQMRGLSYDAKAIEDLRKADAELRSLTDTALLPMLEAWNDEVMEDVVASAENARDLDKATRMSAQLMSHTILLLRNIPREMWAQNTCSIALAATMFLTTRHTFNQDSLHVPESEIFDVLQLHRRTLASWLYSHPPEQLGLVMDSAVRVATSTGKRTEGTSFLWGYVAGQDCVGRYTRVDEETTKRPDFDSKKNDLFASVVRAQLELSQCVADGSALPHQNTVVCINEGLQDVEINIHVLSLTFKAAHLVALPSHIATMSDTRTIFAPKVGNNEHRLRSMQCAIMQDAEHRTWVRLVGQEHDIQYWKTDDPRVPLPSDALRFFPDDLTPGEEWIMKLVEPVRRAFFVRSFWQPPIFLLLPEAKLTADQNTVVLSAVCSKTGKKLKEIVALRDHEVAHVFSLFSIGRRFYRRLIYTTNCHFALHSLYPETADRRTMWQPWQRHAAGEVDADNHSEPADSVVILRHPTHPENASKSVETFIPRRILEGLIPSALLESHLFWQDPDDNIRGYPKEKSAMHMLWLHWKDATYDPIGGEAKQLCFQVYRFSRARSCPKVSEKAVLKSQLLTITDEAEEELERFRSNSIGNTDGDNPDDLDLAEGMFRNPTTTFTPKAESATIEDYNLLLLNLLNARKGTPLHSLAQVMARIELLSHVLCWTTKVNYDSSTENTPLTIDLIQLPRLKLTFSARVDANGNTQLFSLDHAHLFISNLRQSLIVNLLQGIPHSLVLSDSNDNVSILVPALEVVRPAISNAPFSTELVVNRANNKWYDALDTRYYLYPVHVSLSFLFTPTLASALYLLALRYFHCEYDDVFRLASTIGTDVEFTAEEEQNFRLLRSSDHRPEAHACRSKIGLLVADSPVTMCWFLPRHAAAMIRSYNSIGLACKLSESEERRLLYVCTMLLRKVDIISEIARKFREDIIDMVVSRVLNKNPMFDGSSSERRQIKDFYTQIASRFREQLDVRTTKDDITRLLDIWAAYRRFSEFTPYLRYILSNRSAFLEAEAKAIETGEPQPCELAVPPLEKDPMWKFYKDYDPMSVKIPEAQPKNKNDEGRVVRMSEVFEYFYCGASVRKAGMCKCHDCGEECGPSNGCPCPSCERFNKTNLHKLRYIPERIPSGSTRLISFYDAFGWIENVLGEDMNVASQEKFLDPALKAFSGQMHRWTMRQDNNSFLRYYEMLTGTTKVRIGSADCAKDLAVLLFPLVNEARRPESALGHLMHYLVNNPQVWSKLPKYNRTGKASFETRMSAIYSGIMQMSVQHNRRPEDPPVVELPSNKYAMTVKPRSLTRADPFTPISTTRILPVLTNTDARRRVWAPFETKHLIMHDGELLSTSDDTRADLRGQILRSVVPEGFVCFLSREEQGAAHVEGQLSFNLHKHSAAATTVAKSMIRRLEKDMDDFATSENGSKFPKLRGLSSHAEIVEVIHAAGAALDTAIAGLQRLHSALVALREEDAAFVSTAFAVAERSVNHISDGGDASLGHAMMHLRRIANQEALLSLGYIVACLACTSAEQDWCQLNPFLSSDVCTAVLNLVTTAVLRANRIGHINRCCESVKELLGMLGKAQHPPEGLDEATLHNYLDALSTSAQQKADNIAGILATKRVYIEEDYSYDPRFLIFEFTWNLVLRSRQRILIEEIHSSIRDEQSIVKQMIMGAGKTTVVGPLLALMLADSKNLVIQVVPPALLDFTRSILRSTFSCVIQKQIFCFSCDRASEIDSEMLSKFEHARHSRGIVVTTPSSIKSVFLKYIEGLDRIEDTSRKPLESMESEVHDLGRVLRVWQDAVLIMDEVDMLLHPLKSELNFPIGAKHDLDFAPTRWKLPIHLIDALFYFHTRRISVSLKDSPEVHAVLADVAAVIRKGLGCNALQGTPHLTLLNLEFYAEEMMMPMARWLLLFLKAHHFAGLSDAETLYYITKRPSRVVDPALNVKIEALEPDHIKTLNLSFEWLTAFLPHAMQKIDRVSFGIMNADDMRRAREEHPNMPRSRYVTAIPFIGKDLPSQSSEFAHPDVVIGLTVLAYRYEGLRRTDFTDIMRDVHATVEKEVGRFNQRRTNIMYNKWVQSAGGRILSNFAYGEQKVNKDDDEQLGMQPSESMVVLEGEDGEPIKKGQMDVLPLKLMKQANRDESDKLFKLFRRTPEVIHWYLCEHIFPEHMRHQKKKLSASGQELGGNILFKRRIGFSGTPSDLLPYELGKCEYEPGTDGKLIHTLTSPQIMSFHIAHSGWTVRSLLDYIGNASPPFHALIDTGALITGMSNLQVAQYLLKHGLPQMEGVVFLDEFDRKMILVRATGRVLKLAECGIPKVKRFAFYDQVHTTGMDIDHTPNAMAVQTLGKDMVFRDFSQGAYRMRGIGQGQTVHLLIIPEVHDLINRTLTSMREALPLGEAHHHHHRHNVLVDVTAWLMVNSIRSEHVQHNQLCLQTIANVWRKEAYATLLAAQETGTFKHGTVQGTKVIEALRVYREPVDYAVPDVVPQPRMFSETIRQLAEPNGLFISSEEGKRVVGGIIDQTTREDEIDNPVIDVQMVQEQEEEREVEAEKDKEQQIEMEKFVDLAYTRDDEMPTSWALDSLREAARAVQFYPLKNFHLYKRRPLDFPDNILLSRNYFNPKWSGHRRIKNVVVTMEWVPSLQQLRTREQPSRDYAEVPEEVARENLARTIALLRDHQGGFSGTLAREFVDIALGHPSVVADSALWQRVDGVTDEEAMLKLLSSNFLRDEQEGRFTVALSLCEAETIRRVIHAKRARGEPFLNGYDAEVALSIAPANNVLLDASAGFTAAPTPFQRQRALQSLRFFDSDLHYNDQDINLLLRSLHVSPPRMRQAFFLQIITCRRRARQRWERTSVSLLFNLETPFSLLHQRAIGLCMKRDLAEKDLHLGDAYLAINASHSGTLSPDEVWGALRFCRMHGITAADVLDFIEIADTHHEGTVQYPDFLAMLTGSREVDDEEGMPTKEESQGKHLPTVEPYGGDELKELRVSREKSRRAQEEEANRELSSEDRRVRTEIEQEQMREELALIQTAENPRLHDASLHFDLEKPELPKLAQFFGAVVPKIREELPTADVDGELPLHFGFNGDARMRLITRSVKLLVDEPVLRKYMLTCEVCLPRPKTLLGKEAKLPLLEMLDNEGETLRLFSFATHFWTRVAAIAPKTGADDASSDDDERDSDSYDSYDEYSSDDDEGDATVKVFVYSIPEKARKHQIRRTAIGQVVEEVVGERISTTVGAVSVEWMKIQRPVEGWVIFDEGGTRFWAQEFCEFSLGMNGQLQINNVDGDPMEGAAPTVFQEEKAAEDTSDSDDDLWDWRFNEWEDPDEYGVEEDEEEEEDGGGGNAMGGDLTDLAAAIKRAKELKVGDKVTRNPDCWDRGNEDGGDGAKGKVTKVGETRVNVTWSNGFKGEYKWGEAGNFELRKVGSADDDDDDLGRDVVNEDKWAPELKKKSKSKCTSCSQHTSIEANGGWFRCNQCSTQLCKKCFKNLEHPEHDFTDMYALSELLKSTMIVRGSTVRIKPEVKEPKAGWQDAPRDGTPGTVLDLDEDGGTVQVNFNDDVWFGQLSEIVVVDAKFEAYSTCWLGSAFNYGGAERASAPALLFVVDQQLSPPVIEGKFKVGEKVKCCLRGSRYGSAEIRAVLPNRKYAVAFDDGDFSDNIIEDKIVRNPFVKGARVRFCGRPDPQSPSFPPRFRYSLQKGIEVGSVGEIAGSTCHSGMVLRLRCKVRIGMRTVVQNICDDEVEIVGEGAWFLHRSEVDEPVPMPKSATVIIERAFNDGVVSVELFIRDGTYTVNFESMTLENPKTREVIGKVSRQPSQPWVKQRERVKFDDGKWHVISIIVDGEQDIQALCDSKPIPVIYDGPSLESGSDDDEEEENEENEERGENEEGSEEDGSGSSQSAERGPQSEASSEGRKENDDSYAERVNLPDVLNVLSAAILEPKPEDPLAAAIEALERERDQLQPLAPPPKGAISSSGGRSEEGSQSDGGGEDDNHDGESHEDPNTDDGQGEEDADEDLEEEEGRKSTGSNSDESDKRARAANRDTPEEEEGHAKRIDEDEKQPGAEGLHTTGPADEPPPSAEPGHDDASGSDSDSGSDEDSVRVELLKDIKRTAGDFMAFDVRSGVNAMYTEHTSYVSRFGPGFPLRRVAQLQLAWGAAATAEAATGIFTTVDAARQWKCSTCGARNSRLLDACAACGNDRFEVEDKEAKRKRKMRVVMPKSREANEQRKRMHGRLRAIYQKQLEEMEAQMAAVL